MTKEALLDALNYVDATREKRTQMAKVVLGQPQLVKPLLEIIVLEDDPISSRASWVLEFTVKKELSLLFPYIDLFLSGLDKVSLESSVRPMAKICECLVLAFFAKKRTAVQEVLDDGHLEQISTVCFDWLIGDHKVAPKAYSMTSLFLLGKKFPWIHAELQLVLEQNYAMGSAAYKARARHTLAKLQKAGV